MRQINMVQRAGEGTTFGFSCFPLFEELVKITTYTVELSPKVRIVGVPPLRNTLIASSLNRDMGGTTASAGAIARTS